MNEELIKITETNGRRAVNARELHAVLNSKQDFSTWIKYRIRKYHFVENQDFEVFNNIVENPSGGRPTIDYAVSLDMAKELAMVENNEAGRKVRQYFIECERKLNTPSLLSKAQIILQQAQMLVEIEQRQQDNERRTLALENRMKAMDEEREKAKKLLLDAPLSSEPLPEMSERALIRKLVNLYSRSTNITQDKVWESMYAKLLYNYKKNINAYQKLKTDKSKLDVAERHGLLKHLYIIISNMVSSIRKS